MAGRDTLGASEFVDACQNKMGQWFVRRMQEEKVRAVD